jgi:hypothetical protein
VLGPKQWKYKRKSPQTLEPIDLSGFLCSSRLAGYLWVGGEIPKISSILQLFIVIPSSAKFSHYLLKERNLLAVSQLVEVNDLTGRLTTDENRVILDDLTPFPQLQYNTSFDSLFVLCAMLLS